MHLKVSTQTKARDAAGTLLELAHLYHQGRTNLAEQIVRWNYAAPYADMLPRRLRSIPQYLTVNESHFLPTGGISLSWKDLPQLFASYRIGGEFQIEVSPQLADRFIPGTPLQVKHKDNFQYRPEFIKTFVELKPIQFFKQNADRAKEYFQEETLKQRGPEFLLATATIQAVTRNNQSATIRIRIDNLKDKETNQELLPPFLKHLAYEYSVSLQHFIETLGPARTALNQELAATARDYGQNIPAFLQSYAVLCLASPKQFIQLSARKYLDHIQELNNQNGDTFPNAHQLLAQALLKKKETLPPSSQNITIIPGEDPQITNQLLNKTGARQALDQYKTLLQQIAGPSADRLSEILLNAYLPTKPLDYKNLDPDRSIQIKMAVAPDRNSPDAERLAEQAEALKAQYQEQARYTRKHNSLLDDPEEFRRQYNQHDPHGQIDTLNISTSPSSIAALRYIRDPRQPQKTGLTHLSYPVRVAKSIEQITPASQLLPLKRPNCTPAQLISLFQVADNPTNQENARQLAASLAAGRQENPIDRTARRFLGAQYYEKKSPQWTPKQAQETFDFVCAAVSHPQPLQLALTSNPIPFLLATGAFAHARQIIPSLETPQQLDLALRAQTATTREVTPTETIILRTEQGQGTQLSQHFVIATQIALAQTLQERLTPHSNTTPHISKTHATAIAQNPDIAATLGIRVHPFAKEEHNLPITIAARLLDITPTAEQIHATLEKLAGKALTLTSKLNHAKTLLNHNPAYHLELSPDNILKALQTPDTSLPITPAQENKEPAPPAVHDQDQDLHNLLQSLHNGESKSSPWTSSAALLYAAARQSAGKKNSALLKLPGESPIELAIKLSPAGPQLTLNSTAPNQSAQDTAQRIRQELETEINVFHTAIEQKTLTTAQTVNLHRASAQLDTQRIPAILSSLENLLSSHDAADTLKAEVRTARTELNSKPAGDHHPNSTLLDKLGTLINETQTQIQQAHQAITQQDPAALSLARELTLQQLLQQNYPNHINTPPGITITDDVIQTNRLWILETLKGLHLNPEETRHQAQAALAAFNNGENPFQHIVPPKTAQSNTQAAQEFQVTFEQTVRPPQFKLTPDPFDQPFETINQERAKFRQAIQYAVITGTLEIPPATANNHQRQEPSTPAQRWIGL